MTSSNLSNVCQNSLNAINKMFGIGVSKDIRSALESLSQCSCDHCRGATIIGLKKLSKKNKLFSDNDLKYAEDHAPNSDCCKLLLAIILLQRLRQKQAILLLNELADKEFAVACLFLGKLPYQALSRSEHDHYLEKAHILGAYKATMILGKEKFNRHGTDADNALSFALFKEVEKSGLKHAIRKLAKWYDKDPTGPQNHHEALRLYHLAAQQGDAEANYILGLIMIEGKYMEKNASKAVEYFSVAADKGNVDAQLSLGDIFFDGDGVEKDKTKACSYFKLAAEQGNKWAKVMLLNFEDGC